MVARKNRDGATNTMPKNKLGIFVRSPIAGEVKSRLSPAVDSQHARDLYLAFVADLVARLGSSKHRPTVFLSGERTPELASILDPRWPVEAQSEGVGQGSEFLVRLPVLKKGPEGYDKYGVALNQVIKHNGMYYGYYHGTALEDWSEWSTNQEISSLEYAC
jgi:hypothetical protein